MSEEIFTVDKFVVPQHAREEFLTRVHATHEVLENPGWFCARSHPGTNVWSWRIQLRDHS
jgi:hypothetical protein